MSISRFNSELNPEVDGRLDRFFEPGHFTGSWMVQFGGPIAAYAVGRIAGSSETAEPGRDLLRAQIVSQGVTQLLKHSVRRRRPDGAGLNSFPSGHTSATFAAASVFHRRYGWKAAIPGYAGAAWVAASRVNEHRHWLSDLPFGASIGLITGRTVTRDVGRLRASPLIGPGGGGVQFSYGIGP